jgi:hypothetical protein
MKEITLDQYLDVWTRIQTFLIHAIVYRRYMQANFVRNTLLAKSQYQINIFKHWA